MSTTATAPSPTSNRSSQEPEVQEAFYVPNTALHRAKVKKSVEQLKRYKGIDRIPRGKLPAIKSTSSKRELADHADKELKRLTIRTVHFFAIPSKREQSASKEAMQIATEMSGKEPVVRL